MKPATVLLRVCLVSIPLLVTAPAYAGEAAVAQQLFTEAKKLIKAGNWADACPKLEESLRLDPGMGTKFNLADCHEHVGKTASAWAGFLEVASEAKTAGQTARERAARTRATALEPQLSRMTLSVRSTDPGLEVKRDGVAVGKAQWGSPVPVNPGDHVVVATAPGKVAWKTVVEVRAGMTALPVEVPALENAPEAAAPSVEPVASPVEPASTMTGPDAASPTLLVMDDGSARSNRGVVGLVIAGVGVAGLGVGTAFGLISKGNRDDSAIHCRGNVCNPTGASLRDDAISAGNVSTIAFGVGAAALVGGVIVWLTAPSGAPARVARAGIHAAPMSGATGTGFAVSGAW